MGERQIQIVGFGHSRIFAATAVNVRPVGNDYAIEFICHDGTNDHGMAMIGIGSPDAIEQIVSAAKMLADGIKAAPAYVPGRSDSTGLTSIQPPVRVSHCVFAKIGDVVSASFAFVHPGLLHALGKEVPEMPLRVDVVFEVTLHISQFLHFTQRLEEINGRRK